MSFFAGNKKLHVTRNQREVSTLDTDKIYTDTVFHSNMNMICSLGEYTTQSSPITYYIQQIGNNSRKNTEYAFEAYIPLAVQQALNDNYVVLTYMDGYSTRATPDQTTYDGNLEVPVSLPLNIKTVKVCWPETDNSSWSITVSPQITTGGQLDISYTSKALSGRTISSSANNEVDLTGWGGNLDKRNFWTASADYATPGGKIPDTKSTSSTKAYIQYHARHLRWRLSDYYRDSKRGLRSDRPYYADLTGITAPTFKFIILNIKFVNSQFVFINPITKTTTPTNDVKLESGKITINGQNLTQLKVLVSSNPNAKGKIDFSSPIVRVPVSVASYTYIDPKDDRRWMYKMGDSVNFLQGARSGNNNMANFMPCPGAAAYIPTNPGYSYAYPDMPSWEVQLQHNPIQYMAYQSEPMGIPTPGNQDLYWRDARSWLFETVTTKQLGPFNADRQVPFALIDTSKFTGLYIDKNGIRGNFNGSEIPIYNTLSAPTHMINLATTFEVPLSTEPVPFSVTQGVAETNYTREVVLYQDSDPLKWSGYCDGLISVEIANTNPGALFMSDIKVQGGVMQSDGTFVVPRSMDTIVSDDSGASLYSGGLREYALVKIRDITEIELFKGYIHGSFKFRDFTVGSQGGAQGGGGVTHVSLLATITLIINPSSGFAQIRLKYSGDYGQYLVYASGISSINCQQYISMTTLNIPGIRVCFTRISGGAYSV